jgi:hypothetical protein
MPSWNELVEEIQKIADPKQELLGLLLNKRNG